jgi:integrase/recombinase XerD
LNKKTIKLRTGHLERFLDFLVTGKEGMDIRDVSGEVILEYIKHLNRYLSEKTKKQLSDQTKNSMVVVIKQLFKWLYLNEHILQNPVEELEIGWKKTDRELVVLTREEMSVFLESLTRLKDRAIYELLYATGIRLNELRNLHVKDIDFENRMLTIREGKGMKDRVIPLNEVCADVLKKHLASREKQKERYVFEGRKGRRMSIGTVNSRSKRLAKARGIVSRTLSAHTFRHTLATHLLEKGMNIRYVQEMLGHESMETTVQYTHMLSENMKRVYKSYHPRENKYYQEVAAGYYSQIEWLKSRLKDRLKELKRRKISLKKRGY